MHARHRHPIGRPSFTVRRHASASRASAGTRRVAPAAGALLGAVLVALTMLAPLAIRAASHGEGGPSAHRSLDDSACITAVERTVHPTTVALGETVDVTTSIRFDCPEMEIPLHVVVVLDASGSMAGAPLEEARSGVLAFVDGLGIGTDPNSKVGLVAFDDAVKVSCPLTADREEIVACLDRVTASGGSAIDVALPEGRRVLRAGRVDPDVGGDIREVMILLSDGVSATGCEPVLREAQLVKSEGILLMTVAIGTASDHGCLRQTASSPRYFFAVDFASGIVAVLERIRADVASLVRSLVIADLPPSALRLVPDSPAPEAEVDPLTGRVTWTLRYVGPSGITVTHRLAAVGAGRHPSSEDAHADFVDTVGDSGHVDFPVDEVTVIDGSPAPSPPPPDVDVTLELDAHVLPVGSRTAGHLALEVDVPHVPARTHLMLVLDASGSMAGEAMEAQKAGVRALVDELEREADPAFRGGLVMYRSDAELLCGLTPDADALRACVEAMSAAGGTSISDGLLLARDVLAAGRPSPGREDVVLMSDGANSTGCEPVLAAADALKADGATIHTVCLGPACDAACLRRAASSPDHHRVAPLPVDLGSAYAGVAAELLSFRPVESATVRLDLPAHLAFDPDGFSQAPDEHDVRTARWRSTRLDDPRLELGFAVESTSSGAAAPSASVRVDFEGGALSERTVEGPSITSGSGPSPTPGTETPPVGPSETPATPTTGPVDGTAVPGTRIFLPIAKREACRGPQPLALAIVLDTSMSMGELGPDLLPKFHNVLAGVDVLLDGLRPGQDRVAFVGFDDGAYVHRSLTHDFDSVRESIGRQLLMRAGSDIGAGVVAGRDLLLEDAGRSESGGGMAMVVITDGRPARESSETAIAAATAARAAGIRVFVIGIGADVDTRALIDLAGGADAYRAASIRPEVIAAFRALVRWIDCGASM